MKKEKNNETDESMWIKIPVGLSDAIRAAEDDDEKCFAIYGAYHEVVGTYQDCRGQNDYVTLTQIVDDNELDDEQKEILKDLLSCKWVFHTKKIEGSSDIMVKPVIFVDDVTREQCEAILQAMEKKNYERLLELSPGIGGGKNYGKKND